MEYLIEHKIPIDIRIRKNMRVKYKNRVTIVKPDRQANVYHLTELDKDQFIWMLNYKIFKDICLFRISWLFSFVFEE